jgi:hypothetical protein
MNKINRPNANLIKLRREKTQISKIRNIKVGITMNTTEIQEIVRYYFEKLYSKKIKILKKWEDF